MSLSPRFEKRMTTSALHGAQSRLSVAASTGYMPLVRLFLWKTITAPGAREFEMTREMKARQINLLAKFASDAAEHYSADLHRFLARRMHRPQDIADLVQEVYIRLLRVENGDFVRNPRAYILRTASNVLSDFMAKNKRAQEHVVVDSEMVDHVTENPSELPSDQLATRLSTQKQLNAALANSRPSTKRFCSCMRVRDTSTTKLRSA